MVQNIQNTYTSLNDKEVKKLLEQYGENKLPEKKPPSQWEILLGQLKSPLVYILIIAAIITFILGDHEDTIIITIAIAINTVLGWYQESKAGKALEALKKMLQLKIKVIRNGKKQEISTNFLVPGDIMILQSGDKVPADGKVIESNRLFMIEAVLTGESVAIEKNTDDTVFMGTIVQGGNGYVLVEKTGANTEIGKIAKDLQGKETMTPLQKQLAYFSKQLSLLVLGIVIIVFIVGLIAGKDILEIFTTAVALAVGAIPEGLLIALTAVLAIGMQRILKKKGLVKNLVSAETLGGVTVICTDKTGTLTQGNMQVVKSIGDISWIAKQALLANDEDNAVALATAERAQKQINEKEIKLQYNKLDSIPFDSENKFMATLTKYDDQNNLLIINGAPDFLIERCNLNKKEKNKIRSEIEKYTSVGYRIVGYAQKKVPLNKTKIEIKDARKDLERVGMIGLSDPVRSDVKEALEKTKAAGIKLIVITGDFTKTAKHIIESLGVKIDDENILLGSELEEMTEEELDKWLEHDSHVKLFARAKPEQKMRIVDALKDDGEVVAMMGDGVNDAPALKMADIGIVVNEASDVAKESADLILLDSSFNTIIAAIEEGRGMFENIRKVILYLLSDAFQEIIVIILSLLAGFPLPMTAAQILWINLVSDGFPNLALTLDPKRKYLMKHPPRNPHEQLVNKWSKQLILTVSIFSGIFSFGTFVWVWKVTGDLAFARSVTFVTLGIDSLIYVFSIKTLQLPFWKENIFNNKRLLAAVGMGFIFLVGPFFIPGLKNFLGLLDIGLWWYPALGTGLLIFGVIEIFKFIVDKRKSHI